MGIRKIINDRRNKIIERKIISFEKDEYSYTINAQLSKEKSWPIW